MYKTDKGQEPYRIDKYQRTVEGASRNKVQQAIRNKMVLVDGKEVKPNYKLKGVQEIVVYTDLTPNENEIVPENIPIDIVYEDAEVMVINKVAGMVVHPAVEIIMALCSMGSLLFATAKTATINERNTSAFGMVHRIDKNTSGLLVLAKTDGAMRHLAKQF